MCKVFGFLMALYFMSPGDSGVLVGCPGIGTITPVRSLLGGLGCYSLAELHWSQVQGSLETAQHLHLFLWCNALVLWLNCKDF